MQKILFICTGNICRSPTAEAIARHKAKSFGLESQFFFDSVGTSGYHVGQPSDPRSAELGESKGIDFKGMFSRKIEASDFEEFDLLMCMDRSHLSSVLALAPAQYQDKVKLFLHYCQADNPWDDEVIDPYYDGPQTFDKVFDVIDAALENFFHSVR